MQSEDLAVIIPTKDRPDELRRLIRNIAAQSIKPCQIIVVDGSVMPVEHITGEFAELKIDYVRKMPPSLTAQRNAGIRVLDRNVALVAFFDDDIVLEDNSLSNMMRFWQDAPPDTGGAGFNVTNEIYKKPTVFEKLFLVNDETPSRILRSGFQSKISCLERTSAVEWLPGAAMVWRKSVLDECQFDERFSGYARYEEVDFSYRVGKRYRMFIVADAKFKHLSRLEDRSFSFALGRMEVLNRVYFVKKNPGFSPFLCGWALFGIFLNNSAKGLLGADKRYILRAWGNISGFTRLLASRSYRDIL